VISIRHPLTRVSVIALSVAMGVGWLISGIDDVAAQSSRARAVSSPTVATAVTTQTRPGWALDRIDQRRLPLDDEYRSRTSGRGVTAYVIDCGAQVGNAQFGNRGSRGANIAGGSWRDCIDSMGVGHATFVSGIVGGATTGVAKRVRIVSVRTLEGGEATPPPPPRTQLRRVVRAIDWVITDAGSRDRPAVVNMSLSFDGEHQRLSDAMARLEDAGITAVVSAGNDGRNACRRSPASIPSALTVGAVNRRDHVWSGSNVGPCVDLFAPGVSVRSVFRGGGVFTYRRSGATSWATPYVTGVAALYLSKHPGADPVQVRRWIRMSATRGQLSGLSPNSANRLLYSFAPMGQ
jgi:subtilisin family serine protease